MPGNAGRFAIGLIPPDALIAALAEKFATVVAQVALQVQPFHAGI